MIYDKTVLALVPIKEHSERIKEKNFRDFCGVPLYHHIIHALDRTYAVDQILIDTDSQRVMAEAPKLSPKVCIIERPPELRGDHVSMNRIIEHDLTKSEADIYIQTHATNPLLKPERIAKALKVFLQPEEEYDSLFSVNVSQSRFYNADGTPVNHDRENLIRTQDLPPIYEENSCLYIFTRESIAKTKRRIGERPLMFETPRIESIDIDDEISFKIAEIIAAYRGLE